MVDGLLPRHLRCSYPGGSGHTVSYAPGQGQPTAACPAFCPQLIWRSPLTGHCSLPRTLPRITQFRDGHRCNPPGWRQLPTVAPNVAGLHATIT